MTKKTFSNLLKSKLVLILTVLCLIFSSACFFTACKNDEENSSSSTSITYPSVSKIEDNENDLIKFGTFETGTYNLSTTSFPYANPTGWNSAAKESNAPSIGYTNIKSGLIDKNAYDNVLENFNKDIDGITLPDEDVVFGATDNNRVLMLNAYSKEHIGTAVSITQSNSISLEKNTKYKISVKVLTANLTTNASEGANIKLISTVNGNTQANVIVNKINVDSWTEYIFFVQTDPYISCSVKLAFGLGRAGVSTADIANCVEGTAFFDDVTIEKTDGALSGDNIAFTYGNTDEIIKNGNTTYQYDMTVNGIFGSSITAGSELSIDGKKYDAIRFAINVKDCADKKDYKAVKLFLDKYTDNGYDEASKVEEECKSFDYSEEEQVYYLLVKNNYEGTTQYYKLRVENENETAPTYTIKNSNATDIPEDKSTKPYSLYTSLANKTVSLYVGYDQDYTEEAEDVYTFTPATTVEDGEIENNPVIIKGYKGIGPNSIYLYNALKDKDGNPYEADFNTYVADGKAGLINSKHKENYNSSIKDALSEIYDTDNQYIQPMYIETSLASYGFIGEEKTISASSYATISVKVRVVNSDCKAYIYIVELGDNAPTVMKLKKEGGNEHELSISLKESDMGDDGWITVNFFIATGASSKKFRIELWNGVRTGDDSNSGVVLFDDIQISTSTSNFESNRLADFFVKGSTLSNLGKKGDYAIDTYTRKLTDTEKTFNKDYPDKAVSYKENYIWAKSDKVVYAVYNTIDPVAIDPYASITDEEDEELDGGCSCNSDPASFWISFSSIALVAVLIVALAALIIKNTLLKRKNHPNDIKSHYKVQSRISKKEFKEAKEQEKEEIKEEEHVSEENAEQPIEENKEETLDNYVYGDVQDFGETETNEQQEEIIEQKATEAEEVKEQPEEKPTESNEVQEQTEKNNDDQNK